MRSSLQYESFEAFSPYSELGPYRAADYWRLPEGEPVELVRGRLMMSPSPTPLHQVILGILYRILEDSGTRAGGLCLLSPMDVVLSDDTILQPDLLYIAKEHRSIIGSRVEGAPDLVVEILSPGTDRRDKTEKLDLYSKYGVSEYWIVDPASKTIEFLLHEDGRYVIHVPSNERYQSPRLREVEFSLRDFWQEVDQRMA